MTFEQTLVIEVPMSAELYALLSADFEKNGGTLFIAGAPPSSPGVNLFNLPGAKLAHATIERPSNDTIYL